MATMMVMVMMMTSGVSADYKNHKYEKGDEASTYHYYHFTYHFQWSGVEWSGVE